MFKRIILLSTLVGMLGCDAGMENSPDAGVIPDGGSCDVPSTSNTSYGLCYATDNSGRPLTQGGHQCATSCGQLPQDGTPGTLLPLGCVETIPSGLTEKQIICVGSCSECE
jgi:hypothetical protein